MCSLEDAFQPFVASAPAGLMNQQPRLAPNKEAQVVANSAFFDESEKKQRRKRRAPNGAVPYGAMVVPDEPLVVEPDRPANRPLPPAEVLGGKPTPYTSTPPSQMLNALETADYFPHPTGDTADKNMYTLGPDWATAFEGVPAPDWSVAKPPKQTTQGKIPLRQGPSWMDGMPTLWEKVPNQQAPYEILDLEGHSGNRLDSFQHKLDKMFKKLEQLENVKTENNMLEVLLFVLGGIFLILIIDILVKQGTQASLLIAAAGGGQLYKRYMPFRQLSR
jgi:hypothetical protein